MFTKHKTTEYFQKIESLVNKIEDNACLKGTPLVSICCPTYNHENYITECLDGFLCQQVEFPYEIIVGDDCSTDKTQSILLDYHKKYPQIIRLRFSKTNLLSIGLRNSRGILNACRGKYIALCEGDDYWIDPLKLQKQVDYLERNPNCGMVYTKARYFYQFKNKYTRNSWGGTGTTFEELIKNNQIPTLTTVLRLDLLRGYGEEIQPEFRNWRMGDYPLWLYIALKSKIHFTNEETSVYRVLGKSLSHPIDLVNQEAFVKSEFAIKQFYLEYAQLKYDKQYFEDSLLANLATNAIMMKNRNLAKGYFGQMKKVSAKNIFKRIICYSRILSFMYRLKNKRLKLI